MDKFKTFSDAILVGAKIRPQTYGELFGPVGSNEIGSCAIGARMEAIFGEDAMNMDRGEILLSTHC